MAYLLTLTEEDVSTINFVGSRYGWSHSLSRLQEGDNFLTESEAWEIRDHMESDCDGGHSLFPMLDPTSDLYSKLHDFVESIV